MEGGKRGALRRVEEEGRGRRRASQRGGQSDNRREVEAHGHRAGETHLVAPGLDRRPEGGALKAQWRVLSPWAVGTASGAVDAVVSAVAEVPFGGGAKAFFSATASSAG